MNRIALLGPTYHEYCTLLNNRLDENKPVLWGWTYQHTPHMLKILERQKTFKIYAYNSYKRTENKQYAKKIIHCYNVYDFDYEKYFTEPPNSELVIHGPEERFTVNRGWYYINGYGRLRLPKKWGDFHLYPSGKTSKVQGMLNRNAHWYYVIDEY